MSRARRRWAGFVTRPRVLLAVGLLGFAGLSFGLAALRAIELGATAFDLGLYEQALWTGAHGGGFYEAPDFQNAGFATFFDVHLSPVLAVIAPVYAAAPTAFTLFALQSAVVALAAIPVYLLARDQRGSTSDGLLAAALFLAWAPLLAGAVFDFHLEAFVPVELFGFLWCWRRRSYLPAAGLVLLTACTADFALPLLGAVAAYETIREFPLPGSETSGWWARCRRWLAEPATWTSAVVVIVSAICWALVITFQAHIPAIDPSAGPTGPPAFSLAGVATSYSLHLDLWTHDVWPKVDGWLLLYALVGFLPWVAPRSQIVAIPALIVTAFQPTAAFVTPGDQHAFLLAVPLFVGVVDGLPRLRRWLSSFEPPMVSRRTSGRWGPRRRIRVSVLFFGAVLVLNLLLSPVDPLVENSSSLGPGYRVSLEPTGTYADALAVAHLLAPGAVVLASTDLFPLVANDPNAYVLAGGVSPGGFSHLPFGSGRLPPSVLLSQDRLTDVPAWLEPTLYNRSLYQLCAVAWDTPVGAILLFETPFTAGCRAGATAYFGPPPRGPATFAPSAFTPGGAGARVPIDPGGADDAIASFPGEIGNVWHGPYVGITPGTYEVTFNLRAFLWPTSNVPSSDAPVLELTISAFGQAPLNRTTVDFGTIGPGSGGSVVMEFTVLAPTVNLEFDGAQVSLDDYVEFTGVSVVPLV